MAMEMQSGARGTGRGAVLGAGRGTVRPSMNVTPLVDVVLVLLIIFMVVTPLLTKKLTLQLPPQDVATLPASAATQAVLYLDGAGRLWLNGEELSLESAPVRLRRVAAAQPGHTVFFDASDDAPFGRAVAMMDLARGAGASTVGILTEPMAPPGR